MADKLVTSGLLIFYFLAATLLEKSYSLKEDFSETKRTHQSDGGINNYPEHAVDGNDTSCTSTDTESGAYWYVDLDQERLVTGVYIDTGPDNSLPYVKITVGQDSPDVGGGTCNYYSPDIVTSIHDVQCYQPKLGQYVKIVNTKEGGLNLCTVKVLGCAKDYFGPNCTSECHCIEEGKCDPQTGFCDGGCAPGYSGNDCQIPCSDEQYGPNCEFNCHCKDSERCDRTTGECPGGCSEDYLGDACQIRLPELKERPVETEKGTSSTVMSLKWPSWGGALEPGFSIIYRVQYRKHNETEFLDGPDITHQPGISYQYASVKMLQRNTFYMFHIQPYLKKDGESLMAGKISPDGGPYRTNCEPPEPPKIQDVEPYTDTESLAPTGAITVSWEPITKAQTKCDDILYYKIQYQSGDFSWNTVITPKDTPIKNITGLRFDTEYQVMVVATNNRNLDGSSVIKVTRTPQALVVTSPDPPTQSLLGAIIAVVVVICLVIVVAIVIVIIVKRRASNYSSVPNKDPEDLKSEPISLHNLNMLKSRSHDASPTDDSGVGEGSSDITPSSVADNLDRVSENIEPSYTDRPIEHRPILVVNLEDFIMNSRDKDNEDVIKEYRSIPEGFTAPHDIGQTPENKHKNRFVNIIAYDHSRVILDKIEGDPDSDYINANYIDGYNQKKAYIAAQGCNKWTVQDMWRMTWQVASHRIIMATNLVENGKRKCEQYWPSKMNEDKPYSDIQVTWIDTEETSEYVMRTFEIKKGDEVRNIKQFHFTAWPDHGVPNRASPIIAFRKKVMSFEETHPGCIVVHCSAGVGRTGTFIAIDTLLEQAREEGVVDIYGLAQGMRKERVSMIQTVEQYIFVYDALLEALKDGDTEIPCSNFRQEFESMCEVDEETGKSRLEEQFQSLQNISVKVTDEDCQSGRLPENKDKNRSSEILPADRHRPYLMLRVPGTNDYINAVFLDGYKRRNGYIVTQMPLPHTVIDFWRTVYEHNCGTIVMLNPANDHDETYGQYWPEDETCECGPFLIEPVAMDDKTHDNLIIRELRLIYQPSSPNLTVERDPKMSKVKMIKQFQYVGWETKESVPESKTTMNALIDLVERSQYKTGNGPVLIHCHDGLDHSGVYTAASCILEKMKVDQEVDVFQTVKHLRYHRPHIIQNAAQYKYLFEVVLAYLAEFETYANFQ